MATEHLVKDFIYVDADRLYSLYSQVFEGVTERIVESFIAGLTTTDSQKGPILRGSNVEAEVAEVSRWTQDRALHDHMYSLLESKLDPVIIDTTSITRDNYETVLRDTFMVRVSGQAEIEDYARLNVYLDRFNELADAIGYAQLTQLRETTTAAWMEREREINAISDRNLKSKESRRLQHEKDNFKKEVNKLLEDIGLRQDEQMLANLRLFIEIFNPDGFGLTVSPTIGNGEIVYRGVLDKRWLRIQPPLLRALYGQAVTSKWTMVGKVTYIPSASPRISAISAVQEIDEALSEKEESISINDLAQAAEGAKLAEDGELETSDDSPSMRDPFRNIFRATRDFEQMFLESKERIEVVIAPLAVYHEVALPDLE